MSVSRAINAFVTLIGPLFLLFLTLPLSVKRYRYEILTKNSPVFCGQNGYSRIPVAVLGAEIINIIGH